MAITKVINSESQAYRPVLTDTLVLDAVPTVNSFNGVTSDAVARAVAGASGEVPQVTENDNGKVLKAIYDEGGPAVEWGEVESGASYTAGDGIDITANAVSVKAGNGLEIGDVTSTGETVSLTTSAYYQVEGAWFAYDICQLTDSLLESIGSGLTLKLLHGTYVAFYPNATAYACLYSYASETSSGVTLDKRLVLGSAIPLNQGFIFDGSEVTFDGSSVNAGLSNTTMADLIADMSSNTYHIGILIKSNDNYLAASYQVTDTLIRPSGPTTMATYTETTTIHDALNVSNPLPTSAVGDAGKVLTVNNSGAAEWTTPSGGGGGSSITWYSTTNPTITSSDFSTNDVLSVTPSGLSFGNTKPGVLYISLGIFNEFQTLPTTIPTPVNVTVKVSGYDAMEEEYTIGQLNAIRFYGGHRYWVSGSVVMPAGLLSGSTTTGNILKVSLTPPDDISGKSWPTTWDDLYMSVGVVN